jgi:hypothetical protein
MRDIIKIIRGLYPGNLLTTRFFGAPVSADQPHLWTVYEMQMRAVLCRLTSRELADQERQLRERYQRIGDALFEANILPPVSYPWGRVPVSLTKHSLIQYPGIRFMPKYRDRASGKIIAVGVIDEIRGCLRRVDDTLVPIC